MNSSRKFLRLIRKYDKLGKNLQYRFEWKNINNPHCFAFDFDLNYINQTNPFASNYEIPVGT
jgi:hypothetical protein